MGILNIFGKKSVAEQGWRVGGMEDFMTLIRVYYQAVMAFQALPSAKISPGEQQVGAG